MADRFEYMASCTYIIFWSALAAVFAGRSVGSQSDTRNVHFAEQVPAACDSSAYDAPFRLVTQTVISNGILTSYMFGLAAEPCANAGAACCGEGLDSVVFKIDPTTYVVSATLDSIPLHYALNAGGLEVSGFNSTTAAALVSTASLVLTTAADSAADTISTLCPVSRLKGGCDVVLLNSAGSCCARTSAAPIELVALGYVNYSVTPTPQQAQLAAQIKAQLQQQGVSVNPLDSVMTPVVIPSGTSSPAAAASPPPSPSPPQAPVQQVQTPPAPVTVTPAAIDTTASVSASTKSVVGVGLSVVPPTGSTDTPVVTVTAAVTDTTAGVGVNVSANTDVAAGLPVLPPAVTTETPVVTVTAKAMDPAATVSAGASPDGSAGLPIVSTVVTTSIPPVATDPTGTVSTSLDTTAAVTVIPAGDNSTAAVVVSIPIQVDLPKNASDPSAT